MKSSWKIFSLALLTFLFIFSSLLVFACGDDDDDDGIDETDDDDDTEDDDDAVTDDDDAADDDDDSTTDDDDDDSSGPDCTVQQLCTHLITDCLFEFDMTQCNDEWSANCADEQGYLECSCDCLDEFSGTDETSCGQYSECTTVSCVIAYC